MTIMTFHWLNTYTKVTILAEKIDQVNKHE